MTERLYYQDSALLEFDARVVACSTHQGHAGLVLDRTAFYPTGGGQPHDLGTLDDLKVCDVVDAEDGTVLHVVEPAEGLDQYPGRTVHGRIDPARRREHLQQHTGQHILSQAFVQVLGHATVSFHMGADTCTIDLDTRDLDVRGLERSQWTAVAERANQIVFDNRRVAVHLVRGDEVANFPIRRQTFSSERVRIIEIEGFDFSTCGGTHARQTGEVGLIAILGTENVKQGVRVEFVCGVRAARKLAALNDLRRDLEQALSTGMEALPQRVAALQESVRSLEKLAARRFERIAEVEAQELLQGASDGATARFLVKDLGQRPLEEARLLARNCCAEARVIVLFAVHDAEAVRLVCARSTDPTLASWSMGKLLRDLITPLGGKGGGSPESAQGSLPIGADVAAFLEGAATTLARCS